MHFVIYCSHRTFNVRLVDEVSKYMIEIFILLMENPMAQTICFWQGCFRLKFTYIYASQTQLEEAILLGGYQ